MPCFRILKFELEDVRPRQILGLGRGRRADRFAAPAFPHEHVQDDVVVFVVGGVAVCFPVGAVDVEFDVALVQCAVHPDGCTFEIRSAAEIPVAGKDHFQLLAAGSFQFVGFEQLIVPDATDDFFRNALFFLLFHLGTGVELGEFQIEIGENLFFGSHLTFQTVPSAVSSSTTPKAVKASRHWSALAQSLASRAALRCSINASI